MNEIKNEIEKVSAKIAELEAKYPQETRPDNMNLLIWKWIEYRRGLIRACAMLGMTAQVTDTKGLKWEIVLSA